MKQNFNKNGFTLIELLAVIVILAIISLIAVPIISSIIVEARKDTFKTSVQNIITAVERICQIEKLGEQEITSKYIFSSNGITPTIEIKGQLPTEGTIVVDDYCNVKVDVSNNDFTVTKELMSEVVLISVKSAANNLPEISDN